MSRKMLLGIVMSLCMLMLTACQFNEISEWEQARRSIIKPAPIEGIAEDELRDIYLAGGCFWGMEAYMARLQGVYDVTVGYANGEGENPSYEDAISGKLGFAETVHVRYDPKQITLSKLLDKYFLVIDPTSKNKQGNDVGIQYRTGIYYTDEADLPIIEEVYANEQDRYLVPLQTEIEPLRNYYLAEEYHQDYLEKNPNGYCHIDLRILDYQEIVIDPQLYPRLSDEALKQLLTEEQYAVAVLGQTEPAYNNAYWNNREPGIYVDITTGEPLFSSADQYDSGTGWPSFTKPLLPEVVTYHEDTSEGMSRTEVRSRSGDIHLGHVFDDGPAEHGGKRYSINSASLRFIPYDQLDTAHYGFLKNAVMKEAVQEQ